MLRKLTLSIIVVAAVAGAVSSLAVARPSRGGWITQRPELATVGRMPSLTQAAPGAASAAVVTVRLQSGSASTLRLELDAAGPATARRGIVFQVADASGVLYAGPLPAARTLALGIIAPGEARSYRFTVELSPSATNAAQGRELAYSAHWLVTEA